MFFKRLWSDASASSLLWDWACSNSNSKCSTLCCLREAARPYRGFLGCHEGQNWPKLMLVFCNVPTPAMRQVTVKRELNFMSIKTCLSHFIGRASWQVDSTFLAESDLRAGHTSLPGFITIEFTMVWSKFPNVPRFFSVTSRFGILVFKSTWS